MSAQPKYKSPDHKGPIIVKNSTKWRLEKYGTKTDSWEDILKRLMDTSDHADRLMKTLENGVECPECKGRIQVLKPKAQIPQPMKR